MSDSGADRIRTGVRALVLLLVAVSAASGVARAGGHINLATISGSIDPASADYLIRAIATSEKDGASALLIELDTPGGLVDSTKDIIQAILNSSVPVIVYVAPRGAWAASAGTFITVSAHVAAMAPSTTIGAAHPVAMPIVPSAPPQPGGEPQSDSGEAGGDAPAKAPGSAPRDVSMEKMENMLVAYMETVAKERSRNVDWVVDAIRNSVAVGEDEALELGVVDVVAEDRMELLESLDGREIKVEGKPMTLALAGLRVVSIEMTGVQRFFSMLANPNLAVVLLLVALAGLYIEFNNPGLIVPGVTGVIAGILLMITLQVLPFSWVGLLIMLLGMALLIAEIFVTSFGVLFAAGIACFLFGGTMIFDTPTVSDLTVSFWNVLVPAVVAVAIFGGVVVFSVGRSLFAPSVSGVDELVGLVGRASSQLDPVGKVFVRGEYWDVVAEEAIEADAPVEVTAVEGMKLRVRRARSNG